MENYIAILPFISAQHPSHSLAQLERKRKGFLWSFKGLGVQMTLHARKSGYN